MSELERLFEIARVLSPEKVQALLAVAEQMTDCVSGDEFLRRIRSAEATDVDETTAAELRSALSERGTTVRHDDIKRELGLV